MAGIYAVKVEGRKKRLLVAEDSATKAVGRVATATQLKASDVNAALIGGEAVWQAGTPMPADEETTEEQGRAPTDNSQQLGDQV